MVRALAIASARPAKIHYSLLASKRASACAALPLATVDGRPVHRDNRVLAAGLFAHALADFCGYRARSATWLGDRGSEGRFCSVEVS